MSVTIVDIARYAGVSKSTVSRVLNESIRVSGNTRDRVLNAVEALDYKPSAAARSLVLKRTDSFSLIVQDLRNPYYAYASWFAERAFQKKGYSLVIHNADNDREREGEILETIRHRGVDGVLSIGGNRNVTSILDFCSKAEIPVVLVDRETPGYDIPTINLDNRLGGRIATEFLLDRGHVDIVFATSDFTVAELRRSEGYRSAFADRGMELPSDSVVVGSEELWSEGICEPLSQMIEGGRIPSAIFASNDIKALHTMRILKEHDLRVPEDVSVVGYDDIFLSRIVVPSLTTVHQPFEHMVEAGVQLLLDMVKGVKVDTEQQLFEPWLMERSSTIVRSGGAVRTGLEDSAPISRGAARRALADLPTTQSIGAARVISDNQ